MDKRDDFAHASIDRREAASWTALWWMAVTIGVVVTRLLYGRVA